MLPPPADEARAFQTAYHARAAARRGRRCARSRAIPTRTSASGRSSACRRRTARRSKGKVLASFRAAQACLRRARARARARPGAQGRRADRRHLSLHRRRRLSLPMRLMAYVAGFGGGPGARAADDRGGRVVPRTDADRREVRAAAALQPRDARFDDALRVVGELQKQYPRNRQLWYEAARRCFAPDASSRPMPCSARASRRFEADRRERMFGEEALWHYKRGRGAGAAWAAPTPRARIFRCRCPVRRAIGCAAARTPSWVNSRRKPAIRNRPGASIVLP